MSDEKIQISRDGGVMILRLNRPAKKNALTYPMYGEIADALELAGRDEEVRVVMLVGQEKSFCAGHDMNEFQSFAEQGEKDPSRRMTEAFVAIDKPVIAAVSGMAIGIGFTLLLHCDLVYVGRGARLQMPFVSIGICPEFGASYILPRMMGHARAAELVLFGEPFTPEHALECGLINAVLPPDELEAHARERAHKLAAQPPAALRTAKQLLKGWTRLAVEQAYETEDKHLATMMEGAEMAEAVAAFTEKRTPDYSRVS